jgi:hypothetical protein
MGTQAIGIMTASKRTSCQRRFGERCDQSRPSSDKSEDVAGSVGRAASARTPFLSVASAVADAMLVAFILVWFSEPDLIIAAMQYECIWR